MTREEYNDISAALDRIMKRVADDETLPKKAAIGAVGVLVGFQLFIKEYYEKHSTATPQGLDKPRDCGRGIHKQEYTGCDMSWMDESQRLDEAAEKYAWEKEEPLSDGERLSVCFNPRIDAFKAGAKWQKSQEFTHIEPFDNEKQAAVHYMEDCQEVDDFVRRKIDYIAERYFCAGAEWMKKKLID